MTGNIHNRNVRFYEEKEADRRAWEKEDAFADRIVEKVEQKVLGNLQRTDLWE